MVHGLSKTRLYKIYTDMKTRCYNPNNSHYKWYGAIGVYICPEWMGENGFQNFAAWALDNGYNDNLTIDRLESSGPYSPNNCRWITGSENSRRAHNGGSHSWSVVSPGPGMKYNKLFSLMAARGMKKTDLLNVISAPTVSKIAKGKSVTTDVLCKICDFLEGQPGDIMEYEK